MVIGGRKGRSDAPAFSILVRVKMIPRLATALLLGLPVSPWAEKIYLEGQLGGCTLREGSVHLMLGIGDEDWGLASGVTTTVARLEDRRTYVSIQPVFPAATGLMGLILVGGAGHGSGEVGGGIGWLAGQILTNSEAKVGSEHLSIFGAHQLDLFVPGPHPREKISLGLEAGYGVMARVAGFRSFCSIGPLDQLGVEFRLVVPVRTMH